MPPSPLAMEIDVGLCPALVNLDRRDYEVTGPFLDIDRDETALLLDLAAGHRPAGDEGAVYIRCARRDTVGIIVRRIRLIETLAALRGVHPDEVALEHR